MNQQPEDQLHPATIRSQSTCSTCPSDDAPNISRTRFWLGLLALIILVGMVIGIVFAAHQYFVDFGGQGFLKSRNAGRPTSSITLSPHLFLPVRKVQTPMESHVWWKWYRRQSDVPYYTCGDQMNSCEAYSQPDICCPTGMQCYSTQTSFSGIFCCNATTPHDCQASEVNPPECLESLIQCSKATGGGCCPSILECTPNGCVHVSSPLIITPSPNISTNSSSGGSSNISSTQSNTGSIGMFVTVTNTIIEQPAATETLAKEGEVAKLVNGSRVSMVIGSYLPYLMAWALICITFGMGML